jgi:hypothetical protein
MTAAFHEAEWLRLLLLISDTCSWVEELERKVMNQLPVANKEKLFRKTFYLSATALAHILGKHYYKMSRHPGCSKFTIDVPCIVQYIRDTSQTEPLPIAGSLNFKRCLDTHNVIGYTRNGEPATFITVITDGAGDICTAFPGLYEL